MTRTERLQFIDDELKGLWPRWAPTEAELRVWMGMLAPLDYGFARTALEQVYRSEAGNYQRPKPKPFLAQAQALTPRLAQLRRRLVRDVPVNAFVQCVTAPKSRPNWTGLRKPVYVAPPAKQGDADYVRTCAESMRKRCERLYGGHWITVVDPAPR